MKGYGPKRERETIVRFDDQSYSSEIWTASETVYRRLLKRLGRAYLTEDGERQAVFVFPTAFIKLPKPKREATEAQRQAAGRMGRGRLSQKAKQTTLNGDGIAVSRVE